MKKLQISALLFCIIFYTHAQTVSIEEDTTFLQSDKEIPTIDLNPGEIKQQEKKKKKKKEKRKVFFDIRSRKIVTKEVRGRNISYYIFHILKVYQKPNPYLPGVYYYNSQKRKMEYSSKYKKDNGMPLHGIYKHLLNGEVVELGSYYIGGKTGRWERYGKNNLLIDKKKYYKGFPKESIIEYWDREKTKIKELIPVHYGVKEGIYMAYYESGHIKERGEYKNGVKIKSWWEYYNRGGKANHKRETVYPQSPYDDTPPYIRREWNEKGKKIVDN